MSVLVGNELWHQGRGCHFSCRAGFAITADSSRTSGNEDVLVPTGRQLASIAGFVQLSQCSLGFQSGVVAVGFCSSL